MAAYKDLIIYELAENVTHEQLLAAAADVAEQWMKKQAGFIAWEIHRTKEGGYMDIVYWESREAAQAAELDMGNIPNGGAWFGCYKKGSISSVNLSLLAKF